MHVLPLSWAGVPCPRCGAATDSFGDHAVSCTKGLFTSRHHGVVNYICQVLTTCKIPFEREAACLGDGRRPADILLKAWEDRKDLALDVTVVHPLPISGDLSIDGARATLRKAGEAKDRLYRDDCERAHIGFTPGVIDTWGGLQPRAQSLWKAITKRAVAGLVGTARANAVTSLRRGLSVAVMRGVAAQLETLQMTCPPQWADADDEVLMGEALDDAGNDWGPRR